MSVVLDRLPDLNNVLDYDPDSWVGYYTGNGRHWSEQSEAGTWSEARDWLRSWVVRETPPSTEITVTEILSALAQAEPEKPWSLRECYPEKKLGADLRIQVGPWI